MNTQSNLSPVRLKRAKQSRYNNPLPQLTRKLDAFEVGYLNQEVNIFNSLEQRDFVRSVVAKRKKAELDAASATSDVIEVDPFYFLRVI